MSRRWLFNIARPFIFVFFILVKIARGISPHHPNLNRTLHRTIHWGLRTFGSPEANTLILRHFHVGTELLAFIKANAGPVQIETVPLRPRTLKDLEDNVFLQHDLNVFNFIIQLNAVAAGAGARPGAGGAAGLLDDLRRALRARAPAQAARSTSSTCRRRWRPTRRSTP